MFSPAAATLPRLIITACSEVSNCVPVTAPGGVGVSTVAPIPVRLTAKNPPANDKDTSVAAKSPLTYSKPVVVGLFPAS